MAAVQIIMPTGAFGASASDDFLATAMCVIAVGFGKPDDWPSKYGTEYENEVFMMHPYCGCDHPNCAWCMGCDCPESSYHYFVDGKEVSHEGWTSFFKSEVGERDPDRHDDWMKRADAVNARRAERHDPVCAYCTSQRFPETGALKGKAAPHFWFKPTGFRLRWYKYIGRDMETTGDSLPADFLQQIFATHPEGMTVDQASTKFARGEKENAKALQTMCASLGL
jgi:hypothetical protein